MHLHLVTNLSQHIEIWIHSGVLGVHTLPIQVHWSPTPIGTRHLQAVKLLFEFYFTEDKCLILAMQKWSAQTTLSHTM